MSGSTDYKLKEGESYLGNGQRVKGQSFERKTAIEMREIGYPDAKRELEYQEARGVDVAGCKPFEIQCKIGKKHSVRANYNEINTTDIGVLRVKWDRSDDLAVLSWEDFKIIAQWLKDCEVI